MHLLTQNSTQNASVSFSRVSHQKGTGLKTPHHSFDTTLADNRGNHSDGTRDCSVKLPNAFTPRLHYSHIPTLLTLEQNREGISDKNKQETEVTSTPSLAVTPAAGTASPPVQSMKSINSVAFDSYWRNSIDFNGVAVTPILCWCQRSHTSVTEVNNSRRTNPSMAKIQHC